jgi:hypothetical protein
MRESGLFHHLIAGEYSRESLAKIEEILESHGTQEILPIAHGLFSASPSQALDYSLTGYQNVRVRDNVMVANAFLQSNCEAQWCIFDPLLSTIYGPALSRRPHRQR